MSLSTFFSMTPEGSPFSSRGMKSSMGLTGCMAPISVPGAITATWAASMM